MSDDYNLPVWDYFGLIHMGLLCAIETLVFKINGDHLVSEDGVKITFPVGYPAPRSKDIYKNWRMEDGNLFVDYHPSIGNPIIGAQVLIVSVEEDGKPFMELMLVEPENSRFPNKKSFFDGLEKVDKEEFAKRETAYFDEREKEARFMMEYEAEINADSSTDDEG